MPNGDYTSVTMKDLLESLTLKVKRSGMHRDMKERKALSHSGSNMASDKDAPLSIKEVTRQVQDLMTSSTTLMVEAGDSWFDSMYISLPEGARYETEIQYGSIGWSVGASFGYAMASEPDRRLVSLIGDGAFQLTAQEVSSMIRYKRNNIMFLINNHGYVSESEIHEGPYNYIKNWDYAALMNAWNAGEGNGLGLRARTPKELRELDRASKEAYRWASADRV